MVSLSVFWSWARLYWPNYKKKSRNNLPVSFLRLNCVELDQNWYQLTFVKNWNFWPKFRFLTNISIFDYNFDFRPTFRFSTTILIFDQNFYFRPKFLFSTKISIFDQNFDFWPKFWISTKISIFHQNFEVSRPNYNKKNVQK